MSMIQKKVLCLNLQQLLWNCNGCQIHLKTEQSRSDLFSLKKKSSADIFKYAVVKIINI